jgi:hypothetical protein
VDDNFDPSGIASDRHDVPAALGELIADVVGADVADHLVVPWSFCLGVDGCGQLWGISV